MTAKTSPESERLEAAKARRQPWRKWGPYVSERQWGTVREDYSADGDAWNYLPHDHARSRAYRWGEDGIGGFCDAKQTLCLAVALWNGKDPILKERMFGLSNREGNHGEDVKELYYYLDAVPTYSYARMLYKYPQAAFPYDLLVQENARRDRRQPEFEIIETGIFDADRYFDVDIEYAKADAEDILLRLTIHNRGPDEAPIHVLPQAWFRNTWSWGNDKPKPSLERAGDVVVVSHETLGPFAIHFDGADEIRFCDNETNVAKLYGCAETGPFCKDGLHEYLVAGRKSAVGSHKGTKAAGIYRRTVAAGGSTTIRVRLSPGPPKPAPFADFEQIFSLRKSEADAFYAELQAKVLDEDLRRIQRQAFAGILWSKQYFYYDVTEWLEGDPAEPKPPKSRLSGRNREWVHATMEDVVSMPDKWEFPWFAGWDWAFHLTTLAYLDLEDAKYQLILLGQAWYMHPNGQLPAYEWNFSDVNPPVQAWAALRLYDARAQAQRQRRPEVSRARLHQAVAQLHLVGEPQGPARPQRLRRRLPRHGQYRRLRPVRAAAGRRHAGAVRRNVMDGDLQPEHAAHRHRAGAGGRCLSGHRDQVLRAFPDDRRGDDQPRRQGLEPVGRHRQFLLRLAGHERRRGDASARSLPGRPDSHVRRRGRRPGLAEEPAIVRQAAGLVFALPAEPRRAWCRAGTRRGPTTGA